MKDQMDRRSFLRMAGMSLGIGVVYEFAPPSGSARRSRRHH